MVWAHVHLRLFLRCGGGEAIVSKARRSDCSIQSIQGRSIADGLRAVPCRDPNRIAMSTSVRTSFNGEVMSISAGKETMLCTYSARGPFCQQAPYNHPIVKMVAMCTFVTTTFR